MPLDQENDRQARRAKNRDRPYRNPIHFNNRFGGSGEDIASGVPGHAAAETRSAGASAVPVVGAGDATNVMAGHALADNGRTDVDVVVGRPASGHEAMVTDIAVAASGAPSSMEKSTTVEKSTTDVPSAPSIPQHSPRTMGRVNQVIARQRLGARTSMLKKSKTRLPPPPTSTPPKQLPESRLPFPLASGLTNPTATGIQQRHDTSSSSRDNVRPVVAPQPAPAGVPAHSIPVTPPPTQPRIEFFRPMAQRPPLHPSPTAPPQPHFDTFEMISQQPASQTRFEGHLAPHFIALPASPAQSAGGMRVDGMSTLSSPLQARGNSGYTQHLPLSPPYTQPHQPSGPPPPIEVSVQYDTVPENLWNGVDSQLDLDELLSYNAKTHNEATLTNRPLRSGHPNHAEDPSQAGENHSRGGRTASTVSGSTPVRRASRSPSVNHFQTTEASPRQFVFPPTSTGDPQTRHYGPSPHVGPQPQAVPSAGYPQTHVYDPPHVERQPQFISSTTHHQAQTYNVPPQTGPQLPLVSSSAHHLQGHPYNAPPHVGPQASIISPLAGPTRMQPFNAQPHIEQPNITNVYNPGCLPAQAHRMVQPASQAYAYQHSAILQLPPPGNPLPSISASGTQAHQTDSQSPPVSGPSFPIHHHAPPTYVTETPQRAHSRPASSHAANIRPWALPPPAPLTQASSHYNGEQTNLTHHEGYYRQSLPHDINYAVLDREGSTGTRMEISTSYQRETTSGGPSSLYPAPLFHPIPRAPGAVAMQNSVSDPTRPFHPIPQAPGAAVINDIPRRSANHNSPEHSLPRPAEQYASIVFQHYNHADHDSEMEDLSSEGGSLGGPEAEDQMAPIPFSPWTGNNPPPRQADEVAFEFYDPDADMGDVSSQEDEGDGDDDDDDDDDGHRISLSKLQKDIRNTNARVNGLFRHYASAHPRLDAATAHSSFHPTGPPPAMPMRRDKRGVVAKHRQHSDLQIQKLVQKHWEICMRNYRRPAEVTIINYHPEAGPPCTMDALTPAVTRAVRSPWNKGVVEVFVDGVLSSNDPALPHRPTAEYRKKLLHYTFARLKSWRVMIQIRDAAALTTHQRVVRRYERKRQLYLRRRDAAAKHEETQRHLVMLADLGVEGMSSDESDHTSSSGLKQYRLLEKAWRNPAVTTCLRTLDALHRRDTYQDAEEEDEEYLHDARTARPGAQPHMRLEYRPKRISSKRPKRGLPACYYSEEVRQKANFKYLEPDYERTHDFSVHPRVIKLALRHTGRACDMRPFPPQ